MNNLEMNLPSGKPPPKKGDQPKINKIAVNGRDKSPSQRSVTVAQLKSTLQQLRRRPGISVVVKGADDVDYQFMVKSWTSSASSTSPRWPGDGSRRDSAIARPVVTN